MSYTTSNLKDNATKSIKKHNLYFIEDVVSFLPCSRSTFYEHFPKGSKSAVELIELLESNRVNTKQEIRNKLLQSSKSSELLAVYKMIATDEERKALSSQYVESTNTNKEVSIEMTPDERNRRIAELEKKVLRNMDISDT